MPGKIRTVVPLWFLIVKVQLTVVASVNVELKVVVSLTPSWSRAKTWVRRRQRVAVGAVLSTVTYVLVGCPCCPPYRCRSGWRCKRHLPWPHCCCFAVPALADVAVPVKTRTVVPLWFLMVKVQLTGGGIGKGRAKGGGVLGAGTGAAKTRRFDAASAVAFGGVAVDSDSAGRRRRSRCRPGRSSARR